MWAILQHVAWEGPGTIAEAMSARGIAHRVYRMDRGETAPAAGGEPDGLVVMGGPMGVYEAERYPHLSDEIALLGRMVRAQRPVLGVCLGAQLLAAALGATVERGATLEIGAGEVELTEAGREDAVLGGEGATALPVVHWHQDTFPLPQGAVRLASSEMYCEQAFRFGERVYGLQFHLEVNDALARAWRGQGLALSAERVAAVAAAGRRTWERFFAVAV